MTVTAAIDGGKYFPGMDIIGTTGSEQANRAFLSIAMLAKVCQSPLVRKQAFSRMCVCPINHNKLLN